MCETSKSDNTIIKDLGLVKTQILLVQLTLVIHKVIRMNLTLANSKNTSYTISHYANGWKPSSGSNVTKIVINDLTVKVVIDTDAFNTILCPMTFI